MLPSKSRAFPEHEDDSARITESPEQTVWSIPASTVGKALTVTSTASVPTQPLASVPVTV